MGTRLRSSGGGSGSASVTSTTTCSVRSTVPTRPSTGAETADRSALRTGRKRANRCPGCSQDKPRDPGPIITIATSPAESPRRRRAASQVESRCSKRLPTWPSSTESRGITPSRRRSEATVAAGSCRTRSSMAPVRGSKSWASTWRTARQRHPGQQVRLFRVAEGELGHHHALLESSLGPKGVGDGGDFL